EPGGLHDVEQVAPILAGLVHQAADEQSAFLGIHDPSPKKPSGHRDSIVCDAHPRSFQSTPGWGYTSTFVDARKILVVELAGQDSGPEGLGLLGVVGDVVLVAKPGPPRTVATHGIKE